MRLNRLWIKSIRNLCEIDHLFSHSKTFIYGENGQGKTNLLESIYLLCLAKSFRTRDDADLLPIEADFFRVEGELADTNGSNHRVVVYFSEATGKKIQLDGKPLRPFSALVGKFPVVALSAGDQSITLGPPSERRRFINILLSQSSHRYLDDLKEYERILKHRNALLSRSLQGECISAQQIDPWDERLVCKGEALVLSREKMTIELNALLSSAYSYLTGGNQVLSLSYKPNVPMIAGQERRETFFRRLKTASAKERKQGISLVGPHRDDFVFMISGRDLRRFGSRGEHKSVLVSLKSAEAFFLQEKTNTAPLLLLDDLFAELDEMRGKKAISLFSQSCQIFITGTTADYMALKPFLEKEGEFDPLFVQQGKVNKQT